MIPTPATSGLLRDRARSNDDMRAEQTMCPTCDADRFPAGYGGPRMGEHHFAVHLGDVLTVESVTINGRERIKDRVIECSAGKTGWIVKHMTMDSIIAGRASVVSILCERCHAVLVTVEHGDVRVLMYPQTIAESR